MKTYLLLILILTITGCARMFTSATTVHVETINKQGDSCKADYTSDKEQEDLKAKVCGGTISTAKSGTLESVVEGVTALQRELTGLIGEFLKGANAGALSTGS